MSKTVHLSLTGRQRGETGAETAVKTVTTAEYYEKNGSIYILYQESAEDADTHQKPGDAASTRCRIKLKDGILELIKTGAVNTRMVFEAGREYLTDYATPYGCLKLGILTHALSCSKRGGKMTIQIKYGLTSERQLISDCEMEIRLTDAHFP